METSQPDESPIDSAPGVNIAGYISSEFGLGEAVRALIRGCRAGGIKCALNNFEKNIHRHQDLTYTDFSTDNPWPVNIIHINPDQLALFIPETPPGYFSNKYNIGYWYWELTELPERWREYLTIFDELWVASSFGAEILRRYSDLPIQIIEPALELAPPVEESSPLQEIGSGNFTFLLIFDFISTLERKNPLLAIDAFLEAFPEKRDVRLVIKSINGDFEPAKKELLLKKRGDDKRIILIDSYLSGAEIKSLIAHCDCYLSPHGAEGLGVSLVEAMALGKPVIATNYSANCDYMTPENSYPVDYCLVELEYESGGYPAGSRWAAPDLNDLVRALREVYGGPEEAARLAQQGQKDVLEKFSAERVGAKIRERLAEIERSTNHFDFNSSERHLKNRLFELHRNHLIDEIYEQSFLHYKSGADLSASENVKIEFCQLDSNLTFRFRLPSGNKSELQWQPVARHGCRIKLESVYLTDEHGERRQFPAAQLHHNGVDEESGWVTFTRFDPRYSLSAEGDIRLVEINAEWQRLSNYTIQEYIRELETQLESRSYRLGRALTWPYRQLRRLFKTGQK